jgi:hypothetical protein
MEIRKLNLSSNSDPSSLATEGQTATNKFDWLCFKKYWQAYWSENSFKAFRAPSALRNVDGNDGAVRDADIFQSGLWEIIQFQRKNNSIEYFKGEQFIRISSVLLKKIQMKSENYMVAMRPFVFKQGSQLHQISIDFGTNM